MSWLDELGEVAGPLVPAATSFSKELESGPAGLRQLVERIETYCENESPSADEDRAFVEGAGAALGLLLIDHVGDGAHVARDGVHRIRLGDCGFFDPFGAIEEVLDADDTRAALASAVRRAEAEARGEGSVSRVVKTLSEALSSHTPPLAVREHFERYVRLSDDTEIDLSRVVEATREGSPADVRRSVDKLTSFLGGGARAIDWHDARPRLLPRLLPPDFVETLPDAADARGELAIEAGAEGLHLALLLSHEGRSRFVRRDEVDAWGIAFAEALDVAVGNLAARSDAARFARVETEAGPLIVARTGDGLDAARLLLPGLSEVLEPELGLPFLVAVPHRDTLLAAPTQPAALVAALRDRARSDAARAPHRISDALYLVTESGFSVARGS